MHEHGLRLADLAGRRVAVIGSATAAHLRDLGIEPAIVPDRFRAEGLVEALRAIGPQAGARVLIARAAEAREVLPLELREFGFEVDVVPLYRVITVDPPPDVLDRLESGTADAVVFASGGTARRFAEVLVARGLDPAALLTRPVVASIGPVTTDALHALGITVDVQAATATSASLVEGLVRRLGARS
jgi:uroporphyrinogen-III synthase